MLRANLDGTEEETVFVFDDEIPLFFTIDIVRQQLFFVMSSSDTPVWRLNLDTLEVTVFDAPGVNAFNIVHDGNSIYWIQPSLFADGIIFKANYEGQSG